MTILAGAGSSHHIEAYQAGRLAAAAAVEPLQGCLPEVLIAFTTDQYQQGEIIRGIRSITGSAALIGCCSGGLITAQGIAPAGVAVLALWGDDLQVTLALEPGLSTQPRLTAERAAEQIEAHLPAIGSGKQSAALILADGVTGTLAVEEALASVTTVLGPLCPLFGGAAGDGLKFAQTWLFADESLQSDAIALALLTTAAPIGIGIRHGWRPVGRKLLVTRSFGNVIYEMDNKPALNVYRELFPEAGITVETFPAFTRYRPLGFPQASGEFLIRLPLSANLDGSIECAGTLPEHAVVQIMDGNSESLLEAAEMAACHAIAALNGRSVAAAIVIDCVTRPPLLGAAAATEVQHIRDVIGHETPLIGMYSFGEFAADTGPVCFHNKAVVVCVIGSDSAGVPQDRSPELTR